jgi:P27 family predicted phage terminase small subunit
VAKKPTLTVVPSTPIGTQPPRKLGQHGLDLWRKIMAEYDISDAGGLEILCQICVALDRAEQAAEHINRDGPVILTKSGLREHPAAKIELANRAFVTRNIQRLGLNIETVKPIGRPPGTWSRE